MEITWYGLSCFRMMERGMAAIVADPLDLGNGSRLRADIVTISHDAPGHNALDSVRGHRYVLDRPGEYEIGGIFITGVATFNPAMPDETRRNVIFMYDFGKINVCHLGDLDHVPTQQQIEALGPVDVLLVPVGGGLALNSSQAAEVISLIEPGVVIPMHYRIPGLPVQLDPLDGFLKQMGVAHVEPMDSFKITGSPVESEDTQVVVLNPQI